MNRLLQGDVGSGKTVVALAAGAVGRSERLSGRFYGPHRDIGRTALQEHSRHRRKDADPVRTSYRKR